MSPSEIDEVSLADCEPLPPEQPNAKVTATVIDEATLNRAEWHACGIAVLILPPETCGNPQ